MKLRSVRTIDPVKTAVRVASVGDIVVDPLPAVVDGVTLVAGDRVLVKEQDSPAENGVYDYGNGRSRDSNQIGDGALGQVVFVAEGAVNAGQAFVVADLVPTRFDPVVHRRTLFDHYLDASPAAADGDPYPVVWHTLAGGQLARDGDKVVARWAGTFASGSSTRRLVVSVSDTAVLDTTPAALGEGSWWMEVTAVRVSATTARVASLAGLGTAMLNVTAPKYQLVTIAGGGDFGNPVPLALSAAVSSGGAATDVVSRLCSMEWVAAAPA